MAILKIARMGHPVLRDPATPVTDARAPEIHALVRDMLETLFDAQGAGLAAPQVHVPLRLVLFRMPAPESARPEDAEGRKREGDGDEPAQPSLRVLINPVITPLTDEMEDGWEGCLSVPGLRGMVPRFTKIRYQGLGLDGADIDVTAEGFHARVVQHECDHLDGILYPQRMRDLSMLVFEEELRHGAPRPRQVAPRNAEDGAGA